ncbi:hypothetical protein DS843_30325 [Roseomonas genomospecies 6]|uniref:Uncharacterized protein n=1 Tax=Roseomonas genomospecies 6 TaxID=214106 RepID=A0A9W7KMR5_9PROT|nr:hypothetical protein DS843_30325 [Roseomonas genomospecies 6]
MRFHRGEGAQTLVSESFDDGSSITYTTGQRSYIETPSITIKPRTFNPFVDMDSYVEARRAGLVPGVRVKDNATPADQFDMDAYREHRKATAKRDEMTDWIAARRRGEVPSC